jgi:hypothetical protein
MKISLRKYPYPYQAMLAICSDLDETPNKDIYFETARYLNTTEDTLLGKGVGLEVGNTIYFDMPDHNFSYTNTDDDGRKKIHKLIQSGHIDCLHSFGDFVNSRKKIEKYWSEICQGERKIEVWVDHAQAPTNLDNDIMQGQGAEVGKPAYHSDLTVKTGTLTFVWKGRVTSCVAQNSKRSYRAIFNKSQVKASLKTIAIEFIKGWLARLGNAKYAMHQDNQVMRKATLIDGSEITEFMRCNPAWGGVSCFDQARGIHQVLTEPVLKTLVKQQGCSILYSHLGKVHSVKEPFNNVTRKAFELLATYQNSKKILTASTRRLLGYLRAQQESDFRIDLADERLEIHVNTSLKEEELQGLTWYVTDTKNVELFINDVQLKSLQKNEPDDSGMLSVSIPWLPLIFPTL